MRNKRGRADSGPLTLLFLFGLIILLPSLVAGQLFEGQHRIKVQKVLFNWHSADGTNGKLIQVDPYGSYLYPAANAFPQKLRPLFSLPISINLADRQTLSSIPGIGVNLSSEIIKLRLKKGRFSSFAELRQIKGIGKGKSALLKRYCLI